MPVKFASSKVIGTNFVMTFRTATGVNGSAGMNYDVQFKNFLSDPIWTTLVTVVGNGTTKSVTNMLPPRPNGSIACGPFDERIFAFFSLPFSLACLGAKVHITSSCGLELRFLFQLGRYRAHSNSSRGRTGETR